MRLVRYVFQFDVRVWGVQTQQDRARAEWLAQRRGAELKELDFGIAKLPESRELR